MTGIFFEELDRAFRNSRFLIVFFLAAACFAFGFYDASRFVPETLAGESMTQNAYELWLFIHFRSYFIYLAPIAAALPFVDSLWVDRNQGFLRFILARVAYTRYLLAKGIANLAAGAVAVGSPLFLLYLYTRLTTSGTYPSPSSVFITWGAHNGSPLSLMANLYPLHPDQYIGFLIVLACLFGAVYATLGLAISSVFNNRYVALAAPFIFFVVTSYIADRALHLGHHWSPETLLIPYNTAEVTGWTIAAQLSALWFGSLLLLFVFGRRTKMVI